MLACSRTDTYTFTHTSHRVGGQCTSTRTFSIHSTFAGLNEGFFFFNSSIFTTVSSSTSSIFSHNIASIIAVIIISNQHIKLSFFSLLSIFAIQSVCVCKSLQFVI